MSKVIILEGRHLWEASWFRRGHAIEVLIWKDRCASEGKEMKRIFLSVQHLWRQVRRKLCKDQEPNPIKGPQHLTLRSHPPGRWAMNKHQSLASAQWASLAHSPQGHSSRTQLFAGSPSAAEQRNACWIEADDIAQEVHWLLGAVTSKLCTWTKRSLLSTLADVL